MSGLSTLHVAFLASLVVLGWAVNPFGGLGVPVVAALTGVALQMSDGHPVFGLAPVFAYLLVCYTLPLLCSTLFVGLAVLCHWSLKALGPNPFPPLWREHQSTIVVFLVASFIILVDVVSLHLGGPSWWNWFHYEIFIWPVVVFWDQLFGDFVEGIWNTMKRFAIPFFVSIAIAGSIPLFVNLGPLPPHFEPLLPSREAIVQILAFCQRSFFSLATSVATGLARGGCLGRVLGSLALLCVRSASLLAILPVFLWGHARGAIRSILENPGAQEPQQMQLVVFRPPILRPPIVLTVDEFDELERREQAKAAAELEEERRFISGETTWVPQHWVMRDQREGRVPPPRHLSPLQRAQLHADAKHHLSRTSSSTFTPADTTRSSTTFTPSDTTRSSLGSRFSRNIQKSVDSQPLAQTTMEKNHRSRVESTYRPAPFFFSDQRAATDPFYASLHPQRPSVKDLKKLVIGGPRTGPLADFYPGLRVKRPEAYVHPEPPVSILKQPTVTSTPNNQVFHPKSPAPIRTQPTVTSTPNNKASETKKPARGGRIRESTRSGAICDSKITKASDMKKPAQDRRIQESTRSGAVGDSKITKASDTKKPARSGRIQEPTLSGTLGDPKITKGPKRVSGSKTNRGVKTIPVSKMTDEPSSAVAHVATSSATTSGPSSEQPLTPTTASKRQAVSGPLTGTDDGYPVRKRHPPSPPASVAAIAQPSSAQQPQPETFNPFQPQTFIPPQPQTFIPAQSQTFTPPQSQTFDPFQSQTFVPAQLPLPQQTYQPPQPTMLQFHHDPQPTIKPERSIAEELILAASRAPQFCDQQGGSAPEPIITDHDDGLDAPEPIVTDHDDGLDAPEPIVTDQDDGLDPVVNYNLAGYSAPEPIVTDQDDDLDPVVNYNLAGYSAPEPIVTDHDDGADPVDDLPSQAPVVVPTTQVVVPSQTQVVVPTTQEETNTESPRRDPATVVEDYQLFRLKENGNIRITTAPDAVKTFSPVTKRDDEPVVTKPAETKPAETKRGLDTTALGRPQTRSQTKLLRALDAAWKEVNPGPSGSKPVVDTHAVGKRRTKNKTKRQREAAAKKEVVPSRTETAVVYPKDVALPESPVLEAQDVALPESPVLEAQDVPLPESPVLEAQDVPLPESPVLEAQDVPLPESPVLEAQDVPLPESPSPDTAEEESEGVAQEQETALIEPGELELPEPAQIDHHEPEHIELPQPEHMEPTAPQALELPEPAEAQMQEPEHTQMPEPEQKNLPMTEDTQMEEPQNQHLPVTVTTDTPIVWPEHNITYAPYTPSYHPENLPFEPIIDSWDPDDEMADAAAPDAGAISDETAANPGLLEHENSFQPQMDTYEPSVGEPSDDDEGSDSDPESPPYSTIGEDPREEGDSPVLSPPPSPGNWGPNTPTISDPGSPLFSLPGTPTHQPNYIPGPVSSTPVDATHTPTAAPAPVFGANSGNHDFGFTAELPKPPPRKILQPQSLLGRKLKRRAEDDSDADDEAEDDKDSNNNGGGSSGSGSDAKKTRTEEPTRGWLEPPARFLPRPPTPEEEEPPSTPAVRPPEPPHPALLMEPQEYKPPSFAAAKAFIVPTATKVTSPGATKFTEKTTPDSSGRKPRVNYLPLGGPAPRMKPSMPKPTTTAIATVLTTAVPMSATSVATAGITATRAAAEASTSDTKGKGRPAGYRPFPQTLARPQQPMYGRITTTPVPRAPPTASAAPQPKKPVDTEMRQVEYDSDGREISEEE